MADLQRISQSSLIQSDYEQDKIEINKQLIQPKKKESTEIDENYEFNFTDRCLGIKYFPEIIAILCLIFIIQDFFTYEEFFEKSLQVSVYVQEHQSELYLQFNQFISYFCILCMGIQVLYLISFEKKRLDAVSFSLYFIICIGMLSVMKLIYHQLRPYMARNSIKAYECAVEFGNPSGHAMMSALCFTIFPYAVDNDFYRFKNKMGKISLTKIFICIFNFIYIGLIMVARISVGVHSLNQVILGFTYGILFSAIYVEFMNGYLNSYISYINQIEKRHKLKYVAYVNLVYVVFIGSLFGIFYLSKNSVSYQLKQQAALEIQSQSICSEYQNQTIQQIQNSSSFLYNKCFIDSGVISLFFAAITAFVLTEAKIQNNFKRYVEGYKQLSNVEIFLRILIQYLPAILYTLSFYIFSHSVLKYETIWKFFIQGIVGYYGAGFIIIYLSPILLKICKLEVCGDYLVLNKQLHHSMTIANQSQDLEDNLDERDKKLTVLQEQHKIYDLQDKNNSRFIDDAIDKKQNISQHQKNNKSNDNIKSESGFKNQRKIEFKNQSTIRMETSMNQTKADEDSERDSYNTNKQ